MDFTTVRDVIKELDFQIMNEWNINPYSGRECIVMNPKDAMLLSNHYIDFFDGIIDTDNLRYMGFKVLRSEDLKQLQYIVKTKREL